MEKFIKQVLFIIENAKLESKEINLMQTVLSMLAFVKVLKI